MKISNFLLLFLFFTATIINAQQENWYHFYKGDNTTDIHETETDIWIGTSVGLTKIDKATDEKIIFNSFNSDLPNSYIIKIKEDHDGNIWVRTWLSISKYDGTEWTHFTASNSILEGSYPAYKYIEVDNQNRVWIINNYRVLYFSNNEWNVAYEFDGGIDIMADSNGDLWLQDEPWGGGNDKILKFENGNWIDHTQFIPSNILIDKIQFQGFDSEGNLWSSVYNLDGYLKWDKVSGGWNFIPLASNILDMGWSFGIDSNDNIWSYSDDSFIKFSEPNNWESIPKPNLPAGNEVGEISIDPNGVIWFTIFISDSTTNWVSKQIGLGKLNLDNEYTTYDLNEPISNYNKIIYAGSDEIVILGGLNHDLLLFENEVFTFTNNGNSEIHSDFYPYIAGQNNQDDIFTFSPTDRLLDIFNFNSFNNIDLPELLFSTTPTIDDEDRIWIGDGSSNNNQGIFYLENDTWEQLDIQNEIFYQEPIQQLSFDGFGNLWIQISEYPNTGLYKYDGTSYSYFNTSNSILTNSYSETIGQDNSGEIWVKSLSQVSKFNNTSNEFEEVIDPNTFWLVFEPQAKIQNMLQTDDEKYYFLSEQRFVSLDENQNFETIIDLENTIDPFLNQAKFRNMEKDNFGNIWIASSLGLYKYNVDSGWTIFDMFNSPLSNPVFSVFVDKDNNVWINAGQSGLYVLSSDDQLTTPIQIDHNNFISLYPNPVEETATISIDLSEEANITIEVYDTMGKSLGIPFSGSKRAGNNLIEFSTNHLVMGIYFCKVEIGKKSHVKKFVKN